MKFIYKTYLVTTSVAAALISLGGFTKIDNYNDIISEDKTKPGVVTNVQVNNVNGGAYLTYSLPKSGNVLYVLAEYQINDKIHRQIKSSYYSDTIFVSGFAQSREYDVTLYAVTRAEVKSDPVQVKVFPDTPPYLLVYPSLSVREDFGGIQVSSENIEEQPVGIVVITKDSNGEWGIAEQVYTDDITSTFSVRGYDTIPREFGVYITDPWGNISDTLIETIKPIYEKEFDKTKFQQLSFPSEPPAGWGWLLPYIWNNSSLGLGFESSVGWGMPQTFTFDMGVRGKLSRYKKWDRYQDAAYGAFSHGNIKRWALWGSNNPQDDILPPGDASMLPGTTMGSWIFIGYFENPPKPSGRPIGDNTPEDVDFTSAGFEFNISLDVPPVRYIRFQSIETYSGGDFVDLMELTFWGTEQ